MPEATVAPHIRLEGEGRAWIDDANVKVIEVALDHIAHGWNAETIQENYPSLTLAQVYAALAWYYDHQAEFDSEIGRQEELLTALRASAKASPLARRVLLGRG